MNFMNLDIKVSNTLSRGIYDGLINNTYQRSFNSSMVMSFIEEFNSLSLIWSFIFHHIPTEYNQYQKELLLKELLK